MGKILQLTPEEGEKAGIAYRGTLKRLQDRIRRLGINLNAKFMKELANKLM
jgi:hypothetical protein